MALTSDAQPQVTLLPFGDIWKCLETHFGCYDGRVEAATGHLVTTGHARSKDPIKSTNTEKTVLPEVSKKMKLGHLNL